MNTYIVSTVLVKNLGTGQTNIANSISEVEAVSEEEAKGKALTQVSKDLPEHQINTMLAVLINANPCQQAQQTESQAIKALSEMVELWFRTRESGCLPIEVAHAQFVLKNILPPEPEGE